MEGVRNTDWLLQNAACFCAEEGEEAVGVNYGRRELPYVRLPAPPGPGPPHRPDLPAIITEGDIYRNHPSSQVSSNIIPLSQQYFHAFDPKQFYFQLKI